jgi:Ca2+/H+ antiporter
MFHPAVLIISVLIAAILIAGVALLLDGIRHQLKSVRKPNLRPQNTHPVNVLPDTRGSRS